MELALNSFTEQYREQLIELSALLKTYGYNITAFHDCSLPHFNSLNRQQQVDVSMYLNAYVGTLKSEYLKGEYNEENMVFQFLFRIGIAPHQELSGTIKNEQYIQIYSRDQIQIYRSLKCYDQCSFTLEQLTTRPWYGLWERDSLFYYACFGLASTALKFIRFTKLKLDFPYHRVTEIDSAQKLSFDYKIKSLTALTRHNKIQAALLVEDWKF